MEDFAPNNLNRGGDAVPLINPSDAQAEFSDSSMDTTSTATATTVLEPKDEPMNPFNSPKNLPQPTLVYKSSPNFPQVELCRDFRDRDQLTDVTTFVTTFNTLIIFRLPSRSATRKYERIN